MKKSKKKRTQFIKFRVSSLEQNTIQKKAKNAGLTASEFLRRLAFKKEIRGRLTPEEIECYQTLIKYADNFRRISNLINKNDKRGVKKETLKTAELIKAHLNKLK